MTGGQVLVSDEMATLEARPLSEELVLAVHRHRSRGLPHSDTLLLLRRELLQREAV